MTAADDLKQVAKRAKNLIEFVQDRLGQDEFTDYEDELTCLDTVLEWLRESAAKHGNPNLFDDGSPVAVNVVLAEGYTATYFPRADGEYGEWFDRMCEGIGPNLTVVE